jgi:hypothetical protein
LPLSKKEKARLPLLIVFLLSLPHLLLHRSSSLHIYCLKSFTHCKGEWFDLERENFKIIFYQPAWVPKPT